METSPRQLRKYNTAVEPHQQIANFCGDDQAQKALFEVSQNELPFPLQMRPVNVDPWFAPEQLNQVKQPLKPTPYFRRTVHLRGNKIQRYEAIQKDFKANYSSSKSIIPRLKNLLYKLQSPEKKSGKEKPIVENPIFFEQNIEAVKQSQKPMVKSHNISIRITNNSSEKKYRKVDKSFKEGKTQMLFYKKKPIIPEIKSMQANFQEHLTLIREARKKRTLRNLLF